jgi:hypothetical protein
LRITPFPNHLKHDKENRENTLIDMEEAHLAHDRERRRRKIVERLARDRERRRRKIAEETNEEREERLARDRGRKRRKVNEENNEEREAHLVVKEEARRAHVRKKYSLRRAKETPNQIAARLSQKKPSMRRKHAVGSIPTLDQKLLRQFHNTMNKLKNNYLLCETCNERFPSIVLIGKECRRCHTENNPKRFSVDNNMDPGWY